MFIAFWQIFFAKTELTAFFHYEIDISSPPLCPARCCFSFPFLENGPSQTAPSERPHREIVPMSRTMQRLRKRIRRAPPPAALVRTAGNTGGFNFNSSNQWATECTPAQISTATHAHARRFTQIRLLHSSIARMGMKID